MRIEGEYDPFIEGEEDASWVELENYKGGNISDNLKVVSAHVTTDGLPLKHIGVIVLIENTVKERPIYLLMSGVIDMNTIDPVFVEEHIGGCHTFEDLAIGAAIAYPSETLGLETDVFDNEKEAGTALLMTLIGN